jgi:hypothetical protein
MDTSKISISPTKKPKTEILASLITHLSLPHAKIYPSPTPVCSSDQFPQHPLIDIAPDAALDWEGATAESVAAAKNETRKSCLGLFRHMRIMYKILVKW